MVALLPGAAVLLALRIRSPLLFVALLPSASIAVLLVVANVGALVGLPFSPLTAGIATLALAAVGAVRLIRSGMTMASRPSAAAVVGLVGAVAGCLLATRMWLRGFGGLDRVAQEHDMITHQVVVAYMARTGRAASWLIRPMDLLTGNPVTFYPQGGHLAPALLTSLGAGPVQALNAHTVLYLGIGWTVSAAVLTAVAARRLRAGTSTAWLAAGTAAVVAPALYRPGVQLMHDGGIYSGAVALALAPGLLAALLLVADESRPRTAVAVGIAAAGLVSVHPSVAVTVGLSLVAWLGGDLLGPGGTTRLRRSLPVLLGAGVVAAVLASPILIQGGGGAGGPGAFSPGRSPYPFGDAFGSAIGLVYGGYLDPERAIAQAGLTALYLFGVFAVLRARRGLGVVTAWAVWVVVTVATMITPAGPARLITGPFYNDLPRVWSHVSLFVPTLAALGVVLGSTAIVTWARRRLPARLPPPLRTSPVVSVLVLVAMAALVLVPVHRGTVQNTATVVSRYADPDFLRVDADDLAAIAFLRSRVPPGERVLNSANDGSTFLYIDAGIPVVNVTSLGADAVPYSYELMRSFSRYPTDPAIRATLRRLNVGWVYVDARAPSIGAGGAPQRWMYPSVRFTVAPGLSGLDRTPLPGLTPAFRSGSVSVYRLDLDRIG